MIIPAPARLLAAHRVRESERADAAFHDPFARLLLGSVDGDLSRVVTPRPTKPVGISSKPRDPTDWLFTARTYAFDRLIAREVSAGADVVVSLAAGLDARPYRLAFPATLRWVELDQPEVLEYKADVLSPATASCAVTFHPVDLANPDARRGAFRDATRGAERALVFCESLLVHLMAADVRELAQDLHAAPFRRWIADIVSPPLMEMLDEESGAFVRGTGAPYLFAPRDGPAVFERAGWHVLGVRSLIQTALKLERLPIALRMAGFLGDHELPLTRPWAGACLLGKEPLEAGE